MTSILKQAKSILEISKARFKRAGMPTEGIDVFFMDLTDKAIEEDEKQRAAFVDFVKLWDVLIESIKDPKTGKPMPDNDDFQDGPTCWFCDGDAIWDMTNSPVSSERTGEYKHEEDCLFLKFQNQRKACEILGADALTPKEKNGTN